MKLETDSYHSEDQSQKESADFSESNAAPKHSALQLGNAGKNGKGKSDSESRNWLQRIAIFLIVGAAIYYTLHNGDLPFDLDVIVARVLGWR